MNPGRLRGDTAGNLSPILVLLLIRPDLEYHSDSLGFSEHSCWLDAEFHDEVLVIKTGHCHKYAYKYGFKCLGMFGHDFTHSFKFMATNLKKKNVQIAWNDYLSNLFLFGVGVNNPDYCLLFMIEHHESSYNNFFLIFRNCAFKNSPSMPPGTSRSSKLSIVKKVEFWTPRSINGAAVWREPVETPSSIGSILTKGNARGGSLKNTPKIVQH